MAEHYFGEFNRNGYSIYCAGVRNQEPVYQAGNCKYDSAQYLPPGSDGTLDIATIEAFCDSAGKELAEEVGTVWDGCARIDDFDEED